MALSPTLQEIVEYRGVKGLVAAKVNVDDNETGTGHGYVTGTVFAIAGVAEISKSTEQSQEAHYYDNIPAIIISSTGSDEITISASAIPLPSQIASRAPSTVASISSAVSENLCLSMRKMPRSKMSSSTT